MCGYRKFADYKEVRMGEGLESTPIVFLDIVQGKGSATSRWESALILKIINYDLLCAKITLCQSRGNASRQ